jgi:hypothetical protein
MSWDTVIPKIVRYTLGDLVSPYVFSDSQIRDTVLVATKFVQYEVDFESDYIVTSLPSGDISPDPTISPECDNDATVLIALKTSAMLEHMDARKLIERDGLKVNLGPANIGTDADVAAITALLKDGSQAAYNKAVFDYTMTRDLRVYHGILTPPALAWAGFTGRIDQGCVEPIFESGSASINGYGDLSSSGFLILNGASDIVASGYVIAEGSGGSTILEGIASISSLGFLNASGNLILFGDADVLASAAVSGDGELDTGISLMTFVPSDQNMRFIANTAHPYWDIPTYPEYSEKAGDTYLTVGTRIQLNLSAEQSICGFLEDPFSGIASAAQLGSGLVNARERYETLYSGYAESHPDTIIANFIGNYSLKDVDAFKTLGYYPTDTDQQSVYEPDCTGEALPESTSPGATSSINVESGVCSDLSVERFIEIGVGNLGRPRDHMIFFDEVGYTLQYWDINKDRFTTIKPALNASGVLCGFNFGGWGFDQPHFFGTDVYEMLPQMCDFLFVEGLYGRDVEGVGGDFIRGVDKTHQVIGSLRSVMDSGVAIGLIGTDYSSDLNNFQITSMTESDAGARLLLTLDSDHHCFPLGGLSEDKFALSSLDSSISGLESIAWTAHEVSGVANQIKLYNRFSSLSSIKTSLGIGSTINTSSGTFTDRQCATRMMAGLVMMTRRMGDPIYVSQVPAIDGSLAGEGDSGNVECWWYWQEQLGAPTTDYTIDFSGVSGLVEQMHRDFENGSVYYFPASGYVEIR